MSDLRFSFPACVIAGKGRITPDDVTLLRRITWPDGIRSRQEAAMALQLDKCCSTSCPEWSVYLAEAVTDFVVWRELPTSVVSGETAGWLLATLADGGAIRSRSGLEILLNVLDIAKDVPHFLSSLALNQVRLALLPEQRGIYAQLRGGGSAVSKSDLAFIWRVLRSALDRGCLHLSRAERLVLQQIDRIGDAGKHHPGWHEMMALARIASDATGFSTRAWLTLEADPSDPEWIAA